MLFRKNLPQDNVEATADAAAVAKLKAQMRRQILIMAACLAVVCVATFAFVSRAWFAMNREVTGDDSGITSDTPSPSLFVRKAGDNTMALASAVNTTTSAKLFPISTADLTNWYYASGFAYTSQTVDHGSYSYTVNTPTANAYTRIASFTDAAAGTYNNTYEGKTRTAYYRSDINLYTTYGNLDVYLDSANPITVTYADNETVAKSLLNCLRVGISSGGAMKLIYAPMAESGTGNSQGSAANTFYYIQNGSLTTAGTNVKTSLTDYLAQPQQVGSSLYTATGSTSICTATTSGTDVSVYVWLEGTDAQALYGLADDDLKGINVTINYVGVEPAS